MVDALGIKPFGDADAALAAAGDQVDDQPVDEQTEGQHAQSYRQPAQQFSYKFCHKVSHFQVKFDLHYASDSFNCITKVGNFVNSFFSVFG